MPSKTKRKVQVGLAVSLLGGPAVGLAAPVTDAKPSCAEVLKQPPKVYIEQTKTRLKDVSEVTEDEAAERWAECKAAENREKLTGQKKLAEKLKRLHELEAEFRRLSIQLASLRTGGGSMFTHGQRRAAAFLEEHHGALIALRLEKAPSPGQSPAPVPAPVPKDIEVRARDAQQKLDAYLKVVLAAAPATDDAAADEVKRRKTTWTKAEKRFREVHGLLVSEFGLEKAREPFATAILEYLVSALWELE